MPTCRAKTRNNDPRNIPPSSLSASVGSQGRLPRTMRAADYNDWVNERRRKRTTTRRPQRQHSHVNPVNRSTPVTADVMTDIRVTKEFFEQLEITGQLDFLDCRIADHATTANPLTSAAASASRDYIFSTGPAHLAKSASPWPKQHQGRLRQAKHQHPPVIAVAPSGIHSNTFLSPRCRIAPQSE